MSMPMSIEFNTPSDEEEGQSQQEEQQEEQELHQQQPDEMKQSAMVTISKRTNTAAAAAAAAAASPMYYTIRFSKQFLIVVCLLASISILFLAQVTYSNQIEQEKVVGEKAATHKRIFDSKFNTNGDKFTEKATDNFDMIDANEIRMRLPTRPKDKQSLSYYHCGVSPPLAEDVAATTSASKDIVEVVLLHGSKFTKEDWKESLILQNLCSRGNAINTNTPVSVTALDLSVESDGLGFKTAFDALVENNVLSGKPVVVVTPSASGKAIVTMVQTDNKNLMTKLVQAWIPVAPPSVLRAKGDDKMWSIFEELDIPILAMNGDGDKMGQQITKKLMDSANASGIEIKGGHPCYLDSPVHFVQVVVSFIQKL